MNPLWFESLAAFRNTIRNLKSIFGYDLPAPIIRDMQHGIACGMTLQDVETYATAARIACGTIGA